MLRKTIQNIEYVMIAIYIRSSTEEQTKEDYSIEFQLNSNTSS
jgi:hypothetical protein